MSGYGRGPPQIDGMMSLKVDNLTYRTTPDDLKIAFDKYGKVGDVYIPRDRFTRESRGFAFVRYYDRRDAEDALDRMDGAILDGRELRVQMAKYGRPQEPRRAMRRSSGYSAGRSSRHSYRSRSRSRSYERRRHSRRSRSSSRHRRSSRRSRTRSRSRSKSDSRSPSGSRSRSRSFSRSKSKSRSRSRSRSKSDCGGD